MRWLLLILLFATPALGTSLRPPTFPELVKQADVVVRGEVVEVRVELQEQGGRKIPFTKVRFAVERTLVGQAPAELELILLGGQTPEHSLTVVGQPRFVAGDRDILFVQGNGRQFSPLVTMGHGRYLIVDAGAGRSVIARSDGTPLRALADITRPLHGPSEANGEASIDTLATTAMSLDAFERQIQETAASLGRSTPAAR